MANYMDVICNQMPEEEQKEFEEVHREEISGVLGSDGVWFNTEVLTAVGEKLLNRVHWHYRQKARLDPIG